MNVTTNYFIKKVQELGYTVEIQSPDSPYQYITILREVDNMPFPQKFADISIKWEAWGSIYEEFTFSGGNEIALLRLIADYLETSLTKRESLKLRHKY